MHHNSPALIVTLGISLSVLCSSLRAQDPPQPLPPPDPADNIYLLTRSDETPDFPLSQNRRVPGGFSTGGVMSSESGWTRSGSIKSDNSTSLWANQPALARWNPLLTTPGTYRVSVFRAFLGKNDALESTYTIFHDGQRTDKTLDDAGGQNGWQSVGEFSFTADQDEYVEFERKPGLPTDQYSRIADIRFERLDAAGAVVATVIVPPTTWLPQSPFADLRSRADEAEIITMIRKGFVTPVTQGHFTPDTAVTLGDSLTWAVATATNTPATNPQAALTLAAKINLLLPDEIAALKSADLAQTVSPARLASLLSAIARFQSRQLPGQENPNDLAILSSLDIPLVPTRVVQGPWQRLMTSLGLASAPKTAYEPVTRAQAALAFRRLLHRVLAPGPPVGADWQLVFEETFDGATIDETIWEIDNSVRVPNKLGRWRENVEVKDGHLRLLNKIERRDGCYYSSGNLWTRDAWQYGYFEASYRYARAVGVNNAFWGFSHATDNPRVELNPNEGWYPDIINAHFYIHHKTDGKVSHLTNGVKDGTLLGLRTGENLADDFHVYGMEWNERELIFYFDGKEIRRLPNVDAHRPIAVWFSTYIGDWAGGIPRQGVDGTFMEVDWVRVWQKMPQQTTTSASPP